MRARLTSCYVLLALSIVSPFGRSLAVADPTIRQSVQHVEASLLPPVLVSGESVELTGLSERMQALHVPGVSIAVIHKGKIHWARGFGVTRLGGPSVNPDTLFQAASISKPVTALAVMRLAQDGKLDLDSDVNRYLKSWKVPGNEYTQQMPVTLRGLLTHSAGVTVHGFLGYAAGEPTPSLLQVLEGKPPANSAAIRVDMTPGKTWRYSGGGFVIVQQLLTDVTGDPFPRLMHDLVLAPLRMRRSTYQQPLSAALLARIATPYQGDGTAVPGGPHLYPELAPAGLWTTPSDLARFAIGIQQALSGKSSRVLSRATAHDMLEPEYDQQALGLVVGGSTPQRYFNHGGVNVGYRCQLVAYQGGEGAVIMTNGDNGDALIREILRTIAYDYAWPDYAPPVRILAAVDPKLFDPYVGTYRFASGNTISFWRDGTHINARLWGQRVFEMFPASAQAFFLKAMDARWVFSGGTDASGFTATLYQNDHQQLVKRLDGVEGQAALKFSMETERRFRAQTPAPESEAALRRLIAGLANGEPHYGEMSPAYAETSRQQLPILQASLHRLGALVSVAFKSVGAAGQDVYDVKFEHGLRECRILLGPGHRIDAADFPP